MHDTRILTSLAEVEREAWDSCFPNALEDYDYLRAVEDAGIEGFRWRYVIAVSEGNIVAAAPAFLSEYALDTTLTGLGKRIVSGLRKVAPGALTLRLGCFGSPCTETSSLGFHPCVNDAARPAILQTMLRSFEQHAAAERCGLLAVKDVAADELQPLWDSVAHAGGYRRVPGLPVAHLDISFTSIEDYLARLSRATRKDMKRKLKSFDAVRVDIKDNLAGAADQVIALYRDTRARADMQFEELTDAYFTGVLERMHGRSCCALYYVGDKLLAANLLLYDDKTLLDKFFCMDGDAGRDFNLYFLSWFTNIRICLERGLKSYQSGQAAYANKLRLGSRLTLTSMYVRHRNVVVNSALHVLAPLFVSSPSFVAEAA